MKRLIAALLFLLMLAGCTVRPSAQEEHETQADKENASPVYTDWSKLTPYEPAIDIYTYHAGYTADGPLEARGDYGALLPYIGKYSVMERYVIDALPFYGLVTDKGEIVSEPVYARINFFDGFLLLYRGDPSGATGGDAFAGGTYSRTLAAPDGRWVRELEDSYYVAYGGGLLLTAEEDRSLDLWNTDGEIISHFDGSAFAPWLGESFIWGEEGGPYIDWTDDRVGYLMSYHVNDAEKYPGGLRLYLDFAEGTVSEEPPEGYPAEIDYSAFEDRYPVPPQIKGCNYLEPVTDIVTGETYFHGYYRDGESKQGRYALFNGSGRLLVDNADLWRFETFIIVGAGLCSTVEDGCFCFRSLADNSLVFRRFMRTNSD